jgi:hypothetical protein
MADIVEDICVTLFKKDGALHQESFGGKVPKYWTPNATHCTKQARYARPNHHARSPRSECIETKILLSFVPVLTVAPRLYPPCSFFGDSPPLDESVGYAIVLGFGIFFSIVTTFLVRPTATIVPLVKRTHHDRMSNLKHQKPNIG